MLKGKYWLFIIVKCYNILDVRPERQTLHKQYFTEVLAHWSLVTLHWFDFPYD